jgi:RNA:NAD 2'-phosphotransferase (TPT1/KptA family)
MLNVAARRWGSHGLSRSTPTNAAKGYSFLVADNGVWLAAKVPPQFITPLPETAL